MNDETKQAIADVLKYKGRDYAILCAVEEMAELTQALMKNVNRHKHDEENIMEEMADVCFFMECIKKIYNISDAEILKTMNEKSRNKRLPRVEKWKAEAEAKE
ncbi:MAG: hypothetical protein FWC51_01180 [Proteobacteria bacterium]|nr:hypothetical protein [Pseudomonadota bacterium]